MPCAGPTNDGSLTVAVTIECEVEFSMRMFRAALSSVVPHAEPTKTGDEVSPLARVRLVLGRDELLVMATCTSTTALAAVDIESDSRSERFAADDGAFSLDLSTDIVRKILQGFKVGRVTADAEDPLAGLIVSTKGFVELEDRDGLIPGMRSRYPHLALSDSFPDVPALLARALGEASASPQAKPLIVEAKPLRLFAHASVAYGRPLTGEPVGAAGSRGWLIWCGPGFIGTLSSEDPGGESLGRRNAERRAHLERLGLAAPRVVDLDEWVQDADEDAEDLEPQLAGV